MPINDKIIQFRRGDSAKNQLLTGADGEITIDKTKKTIVVHDGITAGGSPLATESNIEYGLSGKVDKEVGKQLSTEDYTTAEKSKLDGIKYGATADQTKEDIDLLGIDAATVNGLTVETAVPTGAVFTDTIYDDSTTTKQGNTFNGAEQLVRLGVDGKLPVLDGSNLIGIDGLPDQTGFAGKYLKTDGLVATWESASTGTGITNNEFIATAGQTVFTVTYSVGNIDVYRNGFLLSTEDYVATNGTSITLSNPAMLNDIITVKVYNTFDVANTYTKAEVDFKDSAKQDVLVSGTNIKTINSTSILGSGNVDINTGGLKSVQAFTSSGTWTKPTGINFIKITAVGGGGGGGLGTDAFGGAAGATVIRYVDVTSIASVAIAIGAGGVAGNTSPTAGGNTTISGGITLTANGANGSVGYYIRPRGGAASTETLPNISYRGGASEGTSDNVNDAANGGASFLANGGAGGGSDSALSGQNGIYGSGGGGGINATYPAGAGGNGIVIIEEYIR